MMLRYLMFTFVLLTNVVIAEVPDAITASPDIYQLLLQNDQVSVLRMTLLPGEQDKLHHHNDETVYFERGGLLKISVPGEMPKIVEVADGHVMWHKAWTHQVSNIGETTVVAVIVERQD